MSTERKLLSAIVAMDAKATEDDPPNLPYLMACVSVSSTEFREALTKLYRKGYVTTQWRATPAGRRVATQSLGQVLLRRQPKGRQPERGSDVKTKPRNAFPGAQLQAPLLPMAVMSGLQSNRNRPTSRFPPQMIQGRQQSPPTLPPRAKSSAESFLDVRLSELEELKPRR
ncbi:MAG: hypothetical protein ACI9KE_003246 [Polyangiales bacterium]|jgi:hypothetical protein